MGNEVILHGFFVIIINESKADIKVEKMGNICSLYFNRHAQNHLSRKTYRRNKKVLSTKIPIKRIESLIDIKK